MDYTHSDFEVRFHFSEEEVIVVPFTVTQEIVKTKDYVVNEEIEIDGQKLTVKSVHISPLRVEVRVAFAPNNPKRILTIGSLQLLDENGEEWSRITNGISGFGSEIEGEMSYFLQSNYFREPKALTLVISEVEALEKGQDYIEVDFEKGKVLYMPDLPNLKVTAVRADEVDITYLPDTPNFHRQVLGEGIDANGNKVEGNGGNFSGGDGYFETNSKYDVQSIKNPVKLYINSFPNFLKGSAQVNIQLDE